jgi:hypothetical protein
MRQATQHWAAPPVFLWPEWPEYPSPWFLLTLGIIGGSLLLTALGFALPPSGNADKPGISTSLQTPEDLSGLTATETRSLFGPPVLVRHEPPAEIWQYRSDSCVLDIYLYTDTTPTKIRHAEIRPRTQPVTDADCLHILTVAATN